MVATPLIVALVFFGLAVVYFLYGRQKGRGMRAEITRGESIVINDTDGLCYIVRAVELRNGKTDYWLLTGDKKEVRRTYADYELLDLSKTLTAVSRPIFITAAAVAELSSKIDFTELKRNFDLLRTYFDELQAEHLALKGNVKGEVEGRVEHTERLLKAIPRGKGRAT